MEKTKLLVINVLTADSYNDCHIKGSSNVPLNTLEGYVQMIEKDTPIVLYCASYMCAASASAWRMLNAMGFANVWAYDGGMVEWYHAGLPVEGSCSKSFLEKPVQRPKERDSDIKEITMQELKAMMEEQGLL